MNISLNQPNVVIAQNLDGRWKDATVYNHYDNPLDFMNDVIDNKHLAEVSSSAKRYLEQGIKAYSLIDTKNTTSDNTINALLSKLGTDTDIQQALAQLGITETTDFSSIASDLTGGLL